MARLDIQKLNSELRDLRRRAMGGQTDDSPGATLLRELLSKSTESTERFVLYTLLGGELRLDGKFQDALDCASASFAEFGDIPSQCAVAKALLELGRNDEALNEFKATFAAAREARTLMNYIFGEYMRAAVAIGNIAIIEKRCRTVFGVEYSSIKGRLPSRNRLV